MELWRNAATDRLVQTLLALENTEDCYRFLEDLCTMKELRDMAQRLEVAVLMSEGKNYQEISAATGVSTATISRVSKCVSYGSGGYKAAIEKIQSAGETL